VLAKDDTIDVKTLADRAFMSETTAARCLEAWNACVAALIEVGRLPDPSKKKAAPKAKPAPAAKPAAAETPPAVEPVETNGAADLIHPPCRGEIAGFVPAFSWGVDRVEMPAGSRAAVAGERKRVGARSCKGWGRDGRWWARESDAPGRPRSERWE
jgi:hypothetical protein